MQIPETNTSTREPNSTLVWHALYTGHEHENHVPSTLSGKRFEVFSPLYTAVQRWKQERLRCAREGTTSVIRASRPAQVRNSVGS
jgi:hypothetical protein